MKLLKYSHYLIKINYKYFIITYDNGLKAGAQCCHRENEPLERSVSSISIIDIELYTPTNE